MNNFRNKTIEYTLLSCFIFRDIIGLQEDNRPAQQKKRGLMKKEVKDIRYNVRMTQQTFDIVDSCEGNSFTSKFETLVEHAFIEKKRIDDEILESQLKLDEIKKEITEMRDIKNKLHQIERYIGSVIYSAK